MSTRRVASLRSGFIVRRRDRWVYDGVMLGEETSGAGVHLGRTHGSNAIRAERAPVIHVIQSIAVDSVCRTEHSAARLNGRYLISLNRIVLSSLKELSKEHNFNERNAEPKAN